jgi:hypothetical protein
MSKTHYRLAPQDIPALGAHLVTRRTGYTHHGIYAGNGQVIHYAGFAHNFRSGPVKETNLEAFSAGHITWTRLHPDARYMSNEVITRARSRLCEVGYCFVANNCEHFVLWCIMGKHVSPQVDRGVGVSAVGIGAGGVLTARAVVAGAGVVNGLSASGIMSGLRSVSLVGGGAIGGLVNGPAIAGTGAALLLNHTVLRDRPGLEQTERHARRVGRIASHTASVAAVATGVGAVSASGAVVGLSGAGIASGLAAVGAIVGGGMAAGTVIIMSAPAVAAVGIGYGAYKVAQRLRPLKLSLPWPWTQFLFAADTPT